MIWKKIEYWVSSFIRKIAELRIFIRPLTLLLVIICIIKGKKK